MRKMNYKLLGMSLLLVLGICIANARAQEAPYVTVQANAPGWVTVTWSHSGKGASHFLLQRQSPPYTWVFETNVGTYTDKELNASTTYNYRVCAGEAPTEESCSRWMPVTTLPPASSGGGYATPNVTRQDVTPDRINLTWTSATRYSSFNVRWFKKSAPNDAGQVNVGGGVSGAYEIFNLRPGVAYVVLVQGCNKTLLGSSCSRWGGFEATTPLPLPPPPTAPALTATASSERRIVLTWDINEAERITRTVIERDGRALTDQAAAVNQFEDTVRPNTEYAYRVCISNQVGTACSNTVTAMAKPVAPTPLANVSFTLSRFSGEARGGTLRDQARLKTVVRANWQNTATPGQFITLEREDPGPTGPYTTGKTWVELKKLDAKKDPVEIAIELKSAVGELGFRQGNTYRVCTVVPALGKAGKVCSAPSVPAP